MLSLFMKQIQLLFIQEERSIKAVLSKNNDLFCQIYHYFIKKMLCQPDILYVMICVVV